MSNVPPVECVTTQGLLAGGVVGVHTADDLQHVVRAQAQLAGHIRERLRAYDAKKSGAENETVRNTTVRVGHERAALTDPSGGYLGMGYKLVVAIPGDAHQAAHDVIDGLPSFVDGIQVWAEPWEQAPGKEALQNERIQDNGLQISRSR
jgi:hypothetical protein